MGDPRIENIIDVRRKKLGEHESGTEIMREHKWSRHSLSFFVLVDIFFIIVGISSFVFSIPPSRSHKFLYFIVQ